MKCDVRALKQIANDIPEDCDGAEVVLNGFLPDGTAISGLLSGSMLVQVEKIKPGGTVESLLVLFFNVENHGIPKAAFDELITRARVEDIFKSQETEEGKRDEEENRFR